MFNGFELQAKHLKLFLPSLNLIKNLMEVMATIPEFIQTIFLILDMVTFLEILMAL